MNKYTFDKMNGNSPYLILFYCVIPVNLIFIKTYLYINYAIYEVYFLCDFGFCTSQFVNM